MVNPPFAVRYVTHVLGEIRPERSRAPVTAIFQLRRIAGTWHARSQDKTVIWPSPTKIPWRLRLSTTVLLVIIIGMAITIVIQQRREARLVSALRSARNFNDEAIRRALERPIDWQPVAPVDLVTTLRVVRARSLGNRDGVLWSGIPIYVDPEGLDEVGATMNSVVKVRAAPATPMRVVLRAALDSLGLDYVVDGGLMTVTSKAAATKSRNDRRALPWPH